ncbi:hypothetical protein PVAND_007557 [Polypedilum vanderplanki]|uniref:Uncharacterized protein n=1 Tax=Polypedilum vanderplanki TaxID=319348 RepID=A0A9J6C7Q2_POLVA|nr:hypothetical protein PVAND_007557 [Polypedilum vanderplanki]
MERKNIFLKQKSIDDKTVESSDSQSIGRKILRKQLSVDHVTSSIKHSKAGAPVNFSNLLWQNSKNEPNLRISSSNAIKKRAQFAASANNSISKQDLYKTMIKSAAVASTTGNDSTVTKAREKIININIFLSQDVQDDVCSDSETAAQGTVHKQITTTSSSNVALKSSVVGNSEATSVAVSSKLSASARRAQFQSRRIMSAPIRPLNNDDSKNKRKPRKKKVIRDKDIDESPDEYVDDLEELKQPMQANPNQKSSTKKQPPMRSRSILGCDQMGIETLVSMLNSGESDSEKEDVQQQQQQAPPPPPLPAVKDSSRIRANMLRKTVSFQEDDSQLQSAVVKDPYSFRRNSVVPFAGRMRNTRSLFGQEICNLYMNNTNSNNNNTTTNNSNNNSINNDGEGNGESIKNENDLNSSNQPQEEIKEKPRVRKMIDETSDEKKSQDTTMAEPRELECWRLYEKMKKTGLNISYDTILRGILKPSELRLLEKQKKLLGDIEERTFDDCDEVKQEDGT